MDIAVCLDNLGLADQDWGADISTPETLAAGWRGAKPCPTAAELAAAWQARPVPVPVVISMVQARVALRRAGLLPAVEAAVEAAGGEVYDRWHYGSTIRRDDALVAGLGGQLGLSEPQLDELFIAAAVL